MSHRGEDERREEKTSDGEVEQTREEKMGHRAKEKIEKKTIDLEQETPMYNKLTLADLRDDNHPINASFNKMLAEIKATTTDKEKVEKLLAERVVKRFVMHFLNTEQQQHQGEASSFAHKDGKSISNQEEEEDNGEDSDAEKQETSSSSKNDRDSDETFDPTEHKEDESSSQQ